MPVQGSHDANPRHHDEAAMTAIGIVLIVVGVALVCGGLILRPEASRPDPAGHDDGLSDMRAIINALEKEDQARERYYERTPVP